MEISYLTKEKIKNLPNIDRKGLGPDTHMVGSRSWELEELRAQEVEITEGSGV